MCYTRHLDTFFRAERDRNEVSAQFGDTLPQLFFGAHNGVFRIFPARHDDICGSYDTRKRPWYVAGSSGPKDVVIVLDVSGSMGRQSRLDIARAAAVDVISKLTIGDYFGVVTNKM